MLEKIALAPEKNRTIEHRDISLIDHLEKYGLIEYDRTTLFVTFNIHAIQEYIQKTATKSTEDMDNDERRRYIQDKVRECERKLKKYILQYYTWFGGETAGRHVLLRHISVNPNANPTPNGSTCDFRDLFDHSQFIMYFSDIKKIIAWNKNWGNLGQAISKCGITQAKFESCMEDLNAGRNDANHYDPEDMTCPVEWEISDQTMRDFISAFKTMESIFKKLNL